MRDDKTGRSHVLTEVIHQPSAEYLRKVFRPNGLKVKNLTLQVDWELVGGRYMSVNRISGIITQAGLD